MKKKKFLKIIGFSFVILITVFVAFSGLTYYNLYGKYDVDSKKYFYHVGHIDQEKALMNNTYPLCDEKRIYKTHHGAPDDAFEGSKKQFRNYILTNYKNNSYEDSGYLNFRFYVNCEGNAGWFEIIEMNLDLEETKLNYKMVNQLFELTSRPENWAVYTYDNKPRNYYMYISYRIENGEITEILP